MWITFARAAKTLSLVAGSENPFHTLSLRKMVGSRLQPIFRPGLKYIEKALLDTKMEKKS